MTICQCFPDKDKELLHRYTVASQREQIEVAAPILKDCQVGPPVKGKPDAVKLPRPEETIGSYHTHWVAEEAKPSLTDLSEMLFYGDKAMCIGVGKRPAEVSCFSPREGELFPTLRWLVRGLREDIQLFQTHLTRKYGEATIKTAEESIRARELKGRAETLARRQTKWWEYLGECRV